MQPSDLTRPELEIAASQELGVIRNVLRALGDQAGLGADAGVRMTLGMTGAWGFAMLNSRTAGEAIEIAVRYGYGHSSFVFARPRVEQRRDEVRIGLDASELPPDVRAFLLERDIAAQVTLIPRLLGPAARGGPGPAARVRVETTLDSSRAGHLASLLAPHDVIAACGQDVIVLPAGVLERPLPFADQYALERFKAQCEAIVARHADYRQSSGVTAAVRAAILRDPAHMPSLDEVAHGLHVSPRTLRRQLADAGASFRSLADEARRLIAEDLLESGASVTNVAHRMGYADTTSFIRAFKRWTGRTPGTLVRSA